MFRRMKTKDTCIHLDTHYTVLKNKTEANQSTMDFVLNADLISFSFYNHAGNIMKTKLHATLFVFVLF